MPGGGSKTRRGSSKKKLERAAKRAKGVHAPRPRPKRPRRGPPPSEAKLSKMRAPQPQERQSTKRGRDEPTAKGRRILKSREPKVFEGPKTAMFIRGKNSSDAVREASIDLYHLKEPFAVKYTKKNDILPFEDPSSVEFFAKTSDSALMLFCNHNKKRPNNMIFARFFDNQLLDMIEVGLESYTPMTDFPGEKPMIGAKPAIVLRGSGFETDSKVAAFGNLLIDFFRGVETKEMNLEALSHVIVVTATDSGLVHFRAYMTRLKKSGTRLPHVELEECGPRLDWSMRRHQLADRDLRKQAMQRPLQAATSKPKNITKNAMGDRLGRIHMAKQEFEGFQTRKMKGLKKRRTNATTDAPSASSS